MLLVAVAMFVLAEANAQSVNMLKEEQEILREALRNPATRDAALARMSSGCGGFLYPVFPSSAGKDYSGTCWAAQVSTDEFTDITSCTVRPAGLKYEAYPVLRIEGGKVALGVMGRADKFPGTGTMVRVDANPVIEGGDFFDEPAVEVFFDQLVGASILRVRMTKWPNETYVDEKLDVAGLLDAVDYCRAMLD